MFMLHYTDSSSSQKFQWGEGELRLNLLRVLVGRSNEIKFFLLYTVVSIFLCFSSCWLLTYHVRLCDIVSFVLYCDHSSLWLKVVKLWYWWNSCMMMCLHTHHNAAAGNCLWIQTQQHGEKWSLDTGTVDLLTVDWKSNQIWISHLWFGVLSDTILVKGGNMNLICSSTPSTKATIIKRFCSLLVLPTIEKVNPGTKWWSQWHWAKHTIPVHTFEKEGFRQ